jgi:hypothetical protein
MDKAEQRFVIKDVWIKGSGGKKIHQEFTSTFGEDAWGWSQIKISLRRVERGDFPCTDIPPRGRRPLTWDRQSQAFLQKYPFASARAIAKHFLTTVPTVKEILQRTLVTRKFSRRWAPYSLTSAQKLARVEASTAMLRML